MYIHSRMLATIMNHVICHAMTSCLASSGTCHNSKQPETIYVPTVVLTVTSTEDVGHGQDMWTRHTRWSFITLPWRLDGTT